MGGKDFSMSDPSKISTTFGVSSFLDDICQIYYTPVFSTKHFGKISDLMSATLQSQIPQNFPIRFILLNTASSAFFAQTNESETLTEPIIIECGIDKNQLALGVSFRVKEIETIAPEEITSRLDQKKYISEFDICISNLKTTAHRIALRYSPVDLKFEIVSVFEFSKNRLETYSNSQNKLEIIKIDKPVQKMSKSENYIQLGDLDYTKLLEDDSPGKKIAPSPTGAFLVKSTENQTPEANTLIQGNKEYDQTLLVKDENEENLERFTVVKGNKEKEQDETKIIIKGGGDVASQEKYYLNIIEDLKTKIRALERKSRQNNTQSEDDQNENQTSEPSGVKGLFNKIWPFNSSKTEGTTEELLEEGEIKTEQVEDKISEHAKKTIIADNKTNAITVVQSEISTEENSEPEINQMITNISKVEKEATEIKNEISSPRAKRWVDGLMGELVAEKSKLQDLAKKLTTSVRQKELEYKNKERIFQEELKKRDEILRQKNYALTRVKEQLGQSNIALERIKVTNQKSTEDAHYKQKYSTLQKLLTTSKNENIQLINKIDELRNQLNNSQLTAKPRGPSITDFATLQAKQERAVRQSDEFRKSNQQLILKLNTYKREFEKILAENKQLKATKAQPPLATKTIPTPESDENGSSSQAA